MDTKTTIVYQALVADLAKSAETLSREESADESGTSASHLRLGLLCMIALAFILGCLYSAWYSNSSYDWMWFWFITGIAFLVELLAFWRIWHALRVRARSLGLADTTPHLTLKMLYAAALAGDDELVPPVSARITPSDSITITATDSATFAVAPPQKQFMRDARFMAGFGGMVLLFSWVTSLPLYGNALKWQPLILFPPIAVASLRQFATETRKARTLTVEVRADGLHWGSRRHREFSLPWSEIRGWYVLFPPPGDVYSTTHSYAIHLLIGEHASLAWRSRRQLPWQVATGSLKDAGQSLAMHIQEHVTLPLRDLTPGTLRIVDERKRHPQPLLHLNARVTGPGSYFRTYPGTVLIFMVTVLVLVAGILTPYAQQWYFGGQLNRLEASTTAIRDPLTANTLQWTTTHDAAKSFAFTPTGYVFLSTICCDASSLIAQPFKDGLVEVTVRQQVDFDLNEAGILFRVSRQSHVALAFVVTPNGEWHLNRYTIGTDGALTDSQTLRYEGTFFGIRAVHKGLDATNRLAVLMQGSSYTFFVNGQFVGGYTANELPRSGQVGVYAGSMDGPITFSNLVIAPV